MIIRIQHPKIILKFYILKTGEIKQKRNDQKNQMLEFILNSINSIFL